MERALADYVTQCNAMCIIAEFYSFHPFNDFLSIKGSFFTFHDENRKTVSVSLRNSEDSRWQKYSSKIRNALKKSDLILNFEQSTDVSLFIKLYYETMKAAKASEFYFFSESYFKELLSMPNVRLFTVYNGNVPVSMAFFIEWENHVDYHLSANNQELKELGGNLFLLHKAANYYGSLSFDHLMLGGGTSRNIDDSLLRFKTKLSKELIPYIIAGKVFNEKVYNEYKTIYLETSNIGKLNNKFLFYRF